MTSLMTSEATLEPSQPICSRCLKPRLRVVVFMTRSVRYGKPVMNRGAARNIRLCRVCLRQLLRAFRA